MKMKMIENADSVAGNLDELIDFTRKKVTQLKFSSHHCQLISYYLLTKTTSDQNN